MQYASGGWDGVRRCIEDNVVTPGLKKRAMAYCAEFRKKNAKDPRSYPLHWLVRNLLIHEFNINSVTPIGPGTRAYTIQAEINDSIDRLDEIVDR